LKAHVPKKLLSSKEKFGGETGFITPFELKK